MTRGVNAQIVASMPIEVHAELPLLLLPEYTLFPGTLVPFHLHDPSLCATVSESLADRRLLVVSPQAALSTARRRAGVPHGVGHSGVAAGLGRVVSDRRYPDGRLDLFVHGLSRVRIIRVRDVGGRLFADAMEDADEPGRGAREAARRLRQVAYQLATALADDPRTPRPEESDGLFAILSSTEEPGLLANRLAAFYLTDFRARQALLEMRCPTTRCERLVDLLGEILLAQYGTATALH